MTDGGASHCFPAMRLHSLARAFTALSILAAPLRAQTTTVIVVRHAEKNAEPAADPALTPAGAVRADALVELVKDAGVQAVMSTQYQRTRMTAAPTAARLGLTTEIINAGPAKVLVDSLMARHKGQTVLVVGHSNTVPDIVAALGAAKPAALCDDAYDNAFVVTVLASGTASVTRLHYGAKAGCP